MTLPVIRNEEIARNVYAMDLGPTDPPLSWRPGQWASVRLPVGPHQPLVRAYTLAAPSDDSGVVPLVFDRVEGGLGSTYMAGLKPGDTVDVADIVGKFVLPDPPDADILFVARFTGVVPARCMLLELARQPAPRNVTLVFGARQAADLAFHLEFRALASREPWFSYHPTVLEPDPSWDGPVGEEIDIVRSLPDTGRPYIPMVSGVRALTQPARAFFMAERGFERRAVKVENYD